MELPSAGISVTPEASSTNRAAAEPSYRAILDSLPAQSAVIDRNGIITSANEAWKKFARENGDPNEEYSCATPLLGSQPRRAVITHYHITRHKHAAQLQLDAERRNWGG